MVEGYYRRYKSFKVRSVVHNIVRPARVPFLAPSIALCYLTAIVVIAGGIFGATVLRFTRPAVTASDVLSCLTTGDGVWYRDIAEHGYLRDKGPVSTSRGPVTHAAFFPLFPWCARLLGSATALPPDVSLLIVANLSLIFAFAAVRAYAGCRFPDAPQLTEYSLLSLGFLPTTFFFRMAYAEAMLLMLMVLVLYGIARRWPLSVLALATALATATRPVGVATLLPFGVYVWRTMSGEAGVGEVRPGGVRLTWRNGAPGRCLRTAGWIAIASGGLIAFMAFQWIQLGDPLVFAKSQWNCRLTFGEEVTGWHYWVGLVTLDPVWAVYSSSRSEYWARYEEHYNPLFSLQCANPIYFMMTAVLILVGWRQKWLNRYELLLSAGLLLIPYVTKSYDNAMAGFGRFAAVVFPAHFVVGHLLYRAGPGLAIALLGIWAFWLGIYSAMFAAGYRMF